MFDKLKIANYNENTKEYADKMSQTWNGGGADGQGIMRLTL